MHTYIHIYIHTYIHPYIVIINHILPLNTSKCAFLSDHKLFCAMVRNIKIRTMCSNRAESIVSRLLAEYIVGLCWFSVLGETPNCQWCMSQTAICHACRAIPYRLLSVNSELFIAALKQHSWFPLIKTWSVDA